MFSHGTAIPVSARVMLGRYRTPGPCRGRVVLVPSGWQRERWAAAQGADVSDPRGDVTGGAPEPDEPQR